ncbi:MAG: hypothetical protein PHP79_06525, partial [Clostridia bacterium]|nr:hypothetical protein [Clostridia bacterium]
LCEAEALYREMAEVCKNLDTWSFYVLTSHKGFERLFGRRADRKRKLYNDSASFVISDYLSQINSDSELASWITEKLYLMVKF